jgi:hypothetical protein
VHTAMTGGAFLRLALATHSRELIPELPAFIRHVCSRPYHLWKFQFISTCTLCCMSMCRRVVVSSCRLHRV